MNLKILLSYSIIGFLCCYATEAEFLQEKTEPVMRVRGAHHDSMLSPDIQANLIDKGHVILRQVMRGEEVVRDGLFARFSALNDIKYLYAPHAVHADPGLWGKAMWTAVAGVDADIELRRQDYLMSIICVAWALDDLATQKNQSFSRGSFTLIGHEHRVANYLKGYISLVTGCTEPENLAFAFTSNNFAYRREPTLGGSSHHGKHSPDSQFGIDARFFSGQGVLKVLPHSHSHILFGKLVYDGSHPPLTFFKLEPVGLGNIACAVAHAFNFHHGGAVEDEARREKDLPEVAIAIFQELMPEIQVPKTVWEMYALLTVEGQAIFRERLGDFDFAFVRKGKEVILDLSSLFGA